MKTDSLISYSTSKAVSTQSSQCTTNTSNDVSNVPCSAAYFNELDEPNIT